MAIPQPLPCDVLPCPGGDVIIVPRGQLTIRLTPEQRMELCELLCDTPETLVTWLDRKPVDDG
ncbi:hypothetical protein ETD86_34775 [Nonomuraea turkmeniaca]|uniref:Uncharacterized protein n=1 Tax=Nonomuraea turkmeniaca TaxID=103838 RepID=A0A5S4F612_9ACTN|nr:hypothetical protein [Nonomuraea turkmeniaca]TMR11736.1 hypothetical protein ETD86_34775 [Nonomuraea turkmeniaca]